MQQVESRAADAVAVLLGGKPFAEVFTPAFIAAVPEAQMKAMTTQLEQQLGPLQAVESVTPLGNPGAANLALRFQRGIARGQMQLENAEPYRIAGLRFTAFEPIGDSSQKIAAELAALPGETGVLLAPLAGGAPLLAHNAGKPLAIGSAFKLYVLSALAHEVEAGKRKWSDVVPLSTRSLPSGQMQDWPQGAPVTLHTLATMMIAISDNTATDALIAVLGRHTVEAEMKASGHSRPALNLPFLTTREVFLLKAGDSGRLYTYAHAGEMDRTDMLADLAGEELDPVKLAGAFGTQPRALDVEWFASGEDIARIYRRIADLRDPTARQILAVNAGMTGGARPANLAYVGFKGGSEPGVLNLSWLLQDKAGTWYVLAMSWNNSEAPVEQQTLALLSQRVLALIPKPTN